MGAGEDYHRSREGAAWAPYRDQLVRAEGELRECEEHGLDRALVELAWKVLASAYETARRDSGAGGATHPAAWARAAASHSRSAHVIITTARRLDRDGRAHAELVDIDSDGEAELVLKNDALFAVFAPAHGGRLVYLFDLTGETGRLVVGNPADDWNGQEELNRFMPTHPGGLCDAGHEHDRYDARMVTGSGGAAALLTNIEPNSRLIGARKLVRLDDQAGALRVEYTFPSDATLPAIELALSPDYLALLREGAEGLRPLFGASYRGWRCGDASVWAAIDHGACWRRPRQERGSHYATISLQPEARRVALWVGVGAPIQQLTALYGERRSRTKTS